MFYVCAVRFNVTKNLKKFLDFMCKSNSNSFANFIWQMLLFTNSQNDMEREQKGHLKCLTILTFGKKNLWFQRSTKKNQVVSLL